MAIGLANKLNAQTITSAELPGVITDQGEAVVPDTVRRATSLRFWWILTVTIVSLSTGSHLCERLSSARIEQVYRTVGPHMPQVTIKTGITGPDGREEELNEYLCDWPGCANLAEHVLTCVKELGLAFAVCQQHASASYNAGH